LFIESFIRYIKEKFMGSVNLAFTSALDQARLIRHKEISPLELTALYLDRIQNLDEQLGSYVAVAAELAIADAKTKTELLATTPVEELPPFFGVAIAIKDLNPVAGIPCAYGSRWLKKRIASADDGVVTKIKQAGFIILGKTATAEAGTLPYTEPAGFPPTRNPWNLDYSPSGSSGGSAAALAAGLCAIAHGSDGGGSIRGPAFCCGLVGIKPSRGRVSFAPLGERVGGLAVNAPIGRTVADTAALLDVMAGYVPGDPYWLPDPQMSFLHASQTPPKSLRIAVSTSLSPFGEADPVCKQAILDTAKRLEDLGHSVELRDFCDLSELIEPFTLVFQALLNESGTPEIFLGKMNRWFALRSRFCSCGKYLRATAQLQRMSRKIVACFDMVDAWLLPTYLHQSIQIGEWAKLRPSQTLEKIAHWIAPCPPFNISGQPAIAIPTGLASNGLPVGIQLVGRPADEETLFSLAAQLEAAYPWNQSHPPGFV
jgi:amidase